MTSYCQTHDRNDCREPACVRTRLAEATNDAEVLSHRVGELEEQLSRGASLATTTLDSLRSRGWAVAVHNDYRLNGKPHTFWLLTKGGRCVKGEGETDEEALRQAQEQADLVSAGADGDGAWRVQAMEQILAMIGDPGPNPIGAPGSAMRRAWELGRELIEARVYVVEMASATRFVFQQGIAWFDRGNWWSSTPDGTQTSRHDTQAAAIAKAKAFERG